MEELASGTVLIVEDEDAVATALQWLLESEGFVVHRAVDGVAGLELYRRIEPDLVLLDLMMPRLDGWGVLRAIRQQDNHTQIIMLTALSSVESSALQHGVDDFVAKPYDSTDLVFRVRNRVTIRRALRELDSQRESAVQEVIERYGATIPHELNQPLAVIIGYGELLQRPELSVEQVRRMAREMVKAAQRLSTRVNHLSSVREFRPRHFGGLDLIEITPPDDAE